MNYKKTLSSILQVTGSNIATILAGLIIAFVLPKIITVEGFGYYKTFTLYVTYLGLFSLGIVDGIVLDYGGYNYDELDRPLFRCYYKWYVLITVFFSLIIVLLAFLFDDWNLRFIIISLALNLIAVNISGFFQNISQITQRYKEYSWRRILQSIFNVVVIIAMYLFYLSNGLDDYKAYVISLVVVNLCLTIWYVYTYRDIVFGNSNPLLAESHTVLHLIKIGFPLLFANLSSTLLLTLDRQFVNILFDTKSYAIYAFSYSMLSLVTVATSAISTVLYPTLKRSSLEYMQNHFSSFISIISCFVFFLLVLYYPLKWFITWYLPNYIDSLIIFRIIFPGLGISSVVTVIMHNYYKVLGKNMIFFKRSIVTILLALVLNILFYYFFKTTIAISVASIITLFFWYIYSEWYFRNMYSYKGNKNLIYIILMVGSFYVSTSISKDILGISLYFVFYMVVTLIFFKSILFNIKSLVTNQDI